MSLRDVAYLRRVCDQMKIPYKAGDGAGKLQIEIFEKTGEHTLVQPTFAYAYPAEVSPLSRRNDQDPFITDRWEFFIGGRELANGFSELNDAEDQAQRFKDQVERKDAGDRMQGVERRGVHHEIGDADQKVPGIGLLPRFAVDPQFQVERRGIGDGVGGDQRRAEHAVAIDRFSQRTLFRSTHGDIEADAIACNVAKRLRARHPVGGGADHRGKLDLVVGAAVEVADGDTLAWPDQRTVRLEEQADLLDFLNLLLVMDFGVGARLFEMLFIIDWRRDDLAGIGNWAQQLALRERERRGVFHDLRDALPQFGRLRTSRSPGGSGYLAAGRASKRVRNVAHAVAVDDAEPVIVKAANFHWRAADGASSTLRQAGGRSAMVISFGGLLRRLLRLDRLGEPEFEIGIRAADAGRRRRLRFAALLSDRATQADVDVVVMAVPWPHLRHPGRLAADGVAQLLLDRGVDQHALDVGRFGGGLDEGGVLRRPDFGLTCFQSSATRLMADICSRSFGVSVCLRHRHEPDIDVESGLMAHVVEGRGPPRGCAMSPTKMPFQPVALARARREFFQEAHQRRVAPVAVARQPHHLPVRAVDRQFDAALQTAARVIADRHGLADRRQFFGARTIRAQAGQFFLWRIFQRAFPAAPAARQSLARPVAPLPLRVAR